MSDFKKGEVMNERLIRMLAWVFFGFFLFFLCLQIRNAPVLYDDAGLAAVGKNLFQGNGYSYSYNTFRKFDHAITTGPTLIIPAGLGIKLLGNHYWVPQLTSVFIVLSLVFCFLFGIRKSMDSISFHRFLLMFSFSVFWIVDEVGNSGEYRYFKPFYAVLGEVTGFFFFLIGTMQLMKSVEDREQRISKFIWPSILIGLSILTKFIYIMPTAFLLGCLVLKQNRKIWIQVIKIGALAMIPLAIYHLLRVWIAPESGSFMNFLSGNASGINEVKDSRNLIIEFASHYARNMNILAKTCGGWIGFVMIAGIVFYAIRKYGKQSIRQFSPLLLMILSSSVLLWWIFFHPFGWTRHALPGLMLFWLGMILLISKLKINSVPTLMFVFMGVILFGRNDLILKIKDGLKMDPHVAAQVQTAQKLDELKTPNSLMLGCAWWSNRDMELLMKDGLNFHDCLVVLNREDQSWRNQKVYLVRNTDFWNWENSPILKHVEKNCDQKVIWKMEKYVVSECDAKNL